MRPVLCALAALTLAACDSGTAGFEIGGTYSGTQQESGGSRLTLDLTVPDTPTGSAFAFTVTASRFVGGQQTSSVSAAGTGTYDHPTITLTVQGQTGTGTVSDDGDTIRVEVPNAGAATLTR